MNSKRNWKIILCLVVVVSLIALAGCGGKPASDPKKPAAAPAFKPDKPVTIVVPMAAGGSTDMLARAVEKV